MRPFQAGRKRCPSPFCLSKELSIRSSWQLDLCPLQLGLGFIVFSEAERARDGLAKKRLWWAAYNPQNSSPAKRSPCSCSCGVSHSVMSYQHLGPIGPSREKQSQRHSQAGSAVEALWPRTGTTYTVPVTEVSLPYSLPCHKPPSIQIGKPRKPGHKLKVRKEADEISLSSLSLLPGSRPGLGISWRGELCIFNGSWCFDSFIWQQKVCTKRSVCVRNDQKGWRVGHTFIQKEVIYVESKKGNKLLIHALIRIIF